LVAEFDRAEELSELFDRHIHGEWMALGGGNNILFTQDVERALVVPCDNRIEIVHENEEEVLVRAGAGVEWDDLVAWSVNHQLWGIVNLSLIPGKVGAAPVQNIGAYGAEAKDCIVNVEMYFPEQGNFITLAAEHCNFAYRESVFKHSLKGRVIITAVEFMLSKQAQPKLGYGDVTAKVEELGGVSLKNIRDAICSIRRYKLPDTAVTGNAGSFFKNPIVPTAVAEALAAQYPDMPRYGTSDPHSTKLAAGWLIDQCGLKGYSEGNVGVHHRQALVLINTTGNATGSEVIAFARKVQSAVKEKFGIEIDTEVNIL
jgi:UDP-N-acetylmuramate dehydrogenase